MHITERIEDMSQRGFLRLIMEDDGDIVIAVGQCDRVIIERCQISGTQKTKQPR